MNRVMTYLGAALILLGLSTCETEVDITGDYQRIPVVHGLLDLQADTQFILINRTFLGVGSALEMAQVEDSMLYDNVDAQIAWGSNNAVNLTETRRCGKDMTGAFFAPCYQVYYVTSSELWGNSWPNFSNTQLNEITNRTYRLEIDADGDEIYAETQITSAQGNGNGAIFQPFANADLQLVQNFDSDGSAYAANFRVRWNNSPNSSIRNGVKQRMEVVFNYTEVMSDGSRVDKTVNVPYVTVESENPSNPSEEDHQKVGSFLYSAIANQVQQNPDVLYREVGDVEFVLTVAGIDYTTYLNLGDPVSDVGQDRPRYSNINDGEGVGIFSSRDQYTRTTVLSPVGSTDDDLRELARGIFTRDFCFCTPVAGSTFDCQSSANQCQ